MSSNEIKQKIIITAIECIEQEGIQGTTIRKIADLAGVNVAAINYHFGSKEQLLNIVMNATLDEGFIQNIQDYEDLWKSETKKALKHFLEDTLEGIAKYPNLTKAHIKDPFIKSDYDTNSVQRINEFLAEFHGLINNILLQDIDLKSRIAVSQLFSAILMTGMMPDLYSQFLNLDLKVKENQKVFVQTLIESFCK